MSDPASIRWLPEALCERMAQALQSLLADFSGRWGLPAAATARASREGCAPAGESGALGPDSSFIDLGGPWPDNLREAATQALFQQPLADSPILRGVLTRIEDDLHRMLTDKFGNTTAATTAPRHGHAGLVCDIEWLQCSLRFRLSVSQLRDKGWLIPPAPRPALQRVDLESALAHVPVKLVAQLGSATVNVGDLLHLAPGDVLLLSESLDEPLRIDSPGCKLYLRARLGSAARQVGPTTQRHRAIRCLPHRPS